MNTLRIPVVLAMAGACTVWLSACEDSGAVSRGFQTTLSGRSAAAGQVDDEVLKSRVLGALNAHRRLLGDGISVNVSRGEVTLSGAVPADQIMRADALAWSVPGVKVVINVLRPTASAS